MSQQKAYFPSKNLSLSQGYGEDSSTHKLSYALDFAGVQDVYAPFDCKITKLYQPKDTKNHANTVWLTSTKKVLCPNGYYGYLTISITHPSEISNMKVGTKYSQNTKICTTKKMTGNATGEHYHLEVSKGSTAGWSKKTKGKYEEWVILNKVKPEEYLFVKKDSNVKDDTYKGTKYKFVIESNSTYKYVCNVDDEGLNVRKEPNGEKTGKLLKTATKVEVLEQKDGWSKIADKQWVYSDNLSDKAPKYKTVKDVKDLPLNVRNKPTTEDSKVIGTLVNGDKVQVYSTKNGWAKVSKDEERWVSANYLK